MQGNLINLEGDLNQLLLDGNFLKPKPADELRIIPHFHLRQWAVENARYQFVTTELLEWLKTFIGNRTAIEIGSGQGDLGRQLGIRMTDNYCQQLVPMQMYYAALRQAPTSPPSEVEQIDAIEAVRKYAPQVVVASWVTQKAYADTESHVGANIFGPEEFDILAADCVEAYVHIGNRNSHRDKRIFKVKHRELSFPWLVSRAADQSLNRIWVWGK